MSVVQSAFIDFHPCQRQIQLKRTYNARTPYALYRNYYFHSYDARGIRRAWIFLSREKKPCTKKKGFTRKYTSRFFRSPQIVKNVYVIVVYYYKFFGRLFADTQNVYGTVSRSTASGTRVISPKTVSVSPPPRTAVQLTVLLKTTLVYIMQTREESRRNNEHRTPVRRCVFNLLISFAPRCSATVLQHRADCTPARPETHALIIADNELMKYTYTHRYILNILLSVRDPTRRGTGPDDITWVYAVTIGFFPLFLYTHTQTGIRDNIKCKYVYIYIYYICIENICTRVCLYYCYVILYLYFARHVHGVYARNRHRVIT